LDDDENKPEKFLIGDLEIIVSTTHWQRGRVVNEKSKRSQGSSKKHNTPKPNPQIVIQEQKKSVIGNSSDEDDPKPPKKNLERPHKLTITSKRKVQVNQ
jgi:hypothetical protein